MNDAEAPLAGLRVVELSMYVQGPVSGLVLASHGADVIKIEQVGRQDVMRSLGSMYGVRLDDRGRAWQYAALNRGKRSLALDIASDTGAQVFTRLMADADVFITNLREAALARFGADWVTLSALNPRLVYGRGGGFGLRGPLAQDPCQDTVGMAYGGFMDLSSTTDEPNYPPGALSDVLTGTSVAAAVLAGLVKRSITGKGSLVGSSQVQSLLWMQMLPARPARPLRGGRLARRPRHRRRLRRAHRCRAGGIGLRRTGQGRAAHSRGDLVATPTATLLRAGAVRAARQGVATT